MQEDLKKEIEEFNERLEQCLSDENFMIEGDGRFDSMYRDDIDDDDINAGVAVNQGLMPMEKEYANMLTEERPEADDEEAVDKYLNAELCFDLLPIMKDVDALSSVCGDLMVSQLVIHILTPVRYKRV